MMAFVSACQGHSARTVTVSSQTNAVYAGRIWIIVNSEVPPILFAFSEHLERDMTTEVRLIKRMVYKVQRSTSWKA